MARSGWRDERSPLLDAVDGDGDFLDLGCANGYLLECVVEWGRERGFELNPHGTDLNPLLIQAAIRRFPENAHQFWVANAWGWGTAEAIPMGFTRSGTWCQSR